MRSPKITFFNGSTNSTVRARNLPTHFLLKCLYRKTVPQVNKHINGVPLSAKKLYEIELELKRRGIGVRRGIGMGR